MKGAERPPVELVMQDEDNPYKEVRGLSRGISVLRAMNLAPGGMASTQQLARACGIHRTTCKRLLETLRREGLVRSTEKDGFYTLTFAVQRLSEGFEDEAWIQHVANPMMHAAVPELMWPCDLCTIDDGFMVVRESTHRWSMLSQHRAMIGTRLPLLMTAVGRAYLSACSENEKEALLELVRRRTDAIGELARDKIYVRKVLASTARRGYAVNDGEFVLDPDFAGVAVPVRAGTVLLGAMNLVFPKGACKPNDISTRYVPALLKLATSIGKASVSFLS